MVASSVSRNHFISQKYKTLQLFRPRFLQKNPVVQQYTSVNGYTVVANILGSHSVEDFQLLHRIFIDVSSLTKVLSLQYLFQSREQVKTQLEPGLESMGDTRGHFALF